MRITALLMVSAAVVVTTLVSPVAAQAAPTKETKVAQATETKAEEVKKPEAPKPVMVTVAEGDSLSSIAEKYQSTWVRLYSANESIQNPDVINPGQQLRVPTVDEQLADRPLPQPVVVAAPVTSSYSAPARTTSYRAAAPTATSYPVSANAAKAYIYSRESGNNPTATNPAGCYGIGQDCNGVLRSQCGADYACQDAYFDAYAQRRYGSWEGAYAFWQANHWW
jgi:LysM repeat protein